MGSCAAVSVSLALSVLVGGKVLFAEDYILAESVDLAAGVGGNRSPTCASGLLLL